MPMTFVTPQRTQSNISAPAFNQVLGTFNTHAGTGNTGRIHNIRLATQLINGFILLPGDMFSFNEYIGNTTIEKGFMLGMGFEYGEQAQTAGGGVCQVSSTLYNAAIRGGFEIVRRTSHSMKVGYVSAGFDAAIAYWGGRDLAFRNNRNVPIQIVGTVASNGRLTFEIRGVQTQAHIRYDFDVTGPVRFEYNGRNYQRYTKYRTVRDTRTGAIIEARRQFNTSVYRR